MHAVQCGDGRRRSDAKGFERCGHQWAPWWVSIRVITWIRKVVTWCQLCLVTRLRTLTTSLLCRRLITMPTDRSSRNSSSKNNNPIRIFTVRLGRNSSSNSLPSSIITNLRVTELHHLPNLPTGTQLRNRQPIRRLRSVYTRRKWRPSRLLLPVRRPSRRKCRNGIEGSSSSRNRSRDSRPSSPDQERAVAFKFKI